MGSISYICVKFKLLKNKQITKIISMESITDLNPEIQKKISDFENFLAKDRCTELVFNQCARLLKGSDDDSDARLWFEMACRGISPSDQTGLSSREDMSP